MDRSKPGKENNSEIWTLAELHIFLAGLCGYLVSLADARELVTASQEWISARYKADAEAWGRFDPERWNGFYAWLYNNGLTAHDLSGTGFTNDYLPAE